MTTATVTCPLCEATCGLRVSFEQTEQGPRVTEVRGNPDDVFSKGYLCPKGASLGALHHDPDRLTTPMVMRDGVHVEATWEEAFALIDERLQAIRHEHGNDAVGVYLGNPSVHNLSTSLYGRVLIKALGTTQVYSASSVDQMPKHFTAGYMFGHPLTIPVPDIDRTDHLLMIGANPLVSNGSLMTAPDMRGRLRALRERGGRLVVVDPRRTRTAEIADEHLAIVPGTDALFLLAIAHVLFAEDLVDLGHLTDHVDGLDDVRAIAEGFAPEDVAAHTGIDADVVRRTARDLAAAGSAAVYGRLGTTTQAFGTLASWLVDVLNVLTGNLDKAGGAMFPLAAAGQANSAARKPRPFSAGRAHSRVRGLTEVIGEFPVATLAEEITTPGPGQVRALVTVCGNPCLSTPNAAALDKAMETLDLVVSLDVYLNETTRHADVILPGPSPLARPHYDLALYQLAIHNVANWSTPALTSDVPQEWETLLRLSGIAMGMGPYADVAGLDAFVADDVARRSGLDVAVVGDRVGPARLVDLMLRSGPYDVTLADLESAPNGLDLGPLASRLPGALSTANGRVQLAPEPITKDVPRLAALLATPADPGSMVLIGRRHVSSNNSWMHNIPALVRGGNTCTAQLHPRDAERLGLRDGVDAIVRSRTGEVRVPVEVTDTARPGTVSIPHGWGHGTDGTRTTTATEHAGVNCNVLVDDAFLDEPTGTTALNGVPVEVVPA
ncbi:molybdopterin-dependent oxidoreductase [Nocardioides montaniterrae]